MFLESFIYQAPGKLVEFRANHLFPSESLPDKKIWEDVLMDRNLSTNLDIMMDSKVNHWVIDDLRSTTLNYAINMGGHGQASLNDNRDRSYTCRPNQLHKYTIDKLVIRMGGTDLNKVIPAFYDQKILKMQIVDELAELLICDEFEKRKKIMVPNYEPKEDFYKLTNITKDAMNRYTLLLIVVDYTVPAWTST